MMVCTQCGFQNETEDAFCGSCGAFLEWSGEKVEDSVPAAVAPTPVEGSAPPAEAPTAAPVEPARDDAGATTYPPGPTSPGRDEEPAPAGAKAEAESVVDLRGEPEPAEAGAGTGAVSLPQRPEASQPAEAEEAAGTEAGAGAVSLPRRPEAAEPAAAKAAAGTAPAAGTARPPAQTPSARKPGAAPAPGPVARRPDAVRPAGPKPRPVPTKPPPKRELRPGDLICRQCQEGNDPHRQFCRRCGASLVEAVEAVPPPPLPWWKRLFVRQPKVVAAGERPMRRGGTGAHRDRRVQLKRLTKVAAVLAVLGIGVGYASTLRSKVGKAVQGAVQTVAPKFEEITPSKVTFGGASLPGHPPELAIDKITNTYWAEGVKGNGEGQRLSMTFEPPIDLGNIGFLLGASDKPENFTTEPRPKDVRLHFFDPAKPNDDRTKDLTLKDVGEFRYYKVEAKRTGRLEIEILTVSPSPKGGTDTSIGEIAFFKRS